MFSCINQTANVWISVLSFRSRSVFWNAGLLKRWSGIKKKNFTCISFNLFFFKLSHHKPGLNAHEGSHPIHNIPTYIFDTFPRLDVEIFTLDQLLNNNKELQLKGQMPVFCCYYISSIYNYNISWHNDLNKQNFQLQIFLNY